MVVFSIHERGHRRIATLGIVILLVASTLVFEVLAPSPAAAANSQDWPTFLHDATRSSGTTDANLSVANSNLLKVKWAFKTGGPVASSASLVGTIAYVRSWDGNEYAINTANGGLIWKQALGQTIDPVGAENSSGHAEQAFRAT
jgi:outer membrane protein assembly factor BamB